MKNIDAVKSSNPKYIVQVGKNGQHRLKVLHQIYAQTTKDFLIKAGLRSGMTVIDAGCGLGYVSMEIARLIGPKGKVIAIDDNNEQLKIAKDNASVANITNIEFICSSVADINSDLVGGEVDFIYGRFILIHLPRPELVLQTLYNSLKVGGIMAFEEPDMSSYFASPSIEAYNKAIKWCVDCGKAVGLNFDIGNKLYFMMSLLGLKEMQFSLQQPLAVAQPQKSIISLLTIECKPKYIEYNIANSDEIDLVVKQLEDFENKKYTYYGCARQYQVFGVKDKHPEQINSLNQIFLNTAINGES